MEAIAIFTRDPSWLPGEGTDCTDPLVVGKMPPLSRFVCRCYHNLCYLLAEASSSLRPRHDHFVTTTFGTVDPTRIDPPDILINVVVLESNMTAKQIGEHVICKFQARAHTMYDLLRERQEAFEPPTVELVISSTDSTVTHRFDTQRTMPHEAFD